MRKADYNYLAFLINHQIITARQIRADNLGDVRADTCALGAIAALKNLASEFTNGASVDEKEFLRACGIQ